MTDFQAVGSKKKSSARSRDAENPIAARIVEVKVQYVPVKLLERIVK